MSSDLMLDVSQAVELKMGFRRGDWTNAEIKFLSEGDLLKQVREVILGRSEIKPIEHVINCGTRPFVPEGWEIVDHQAPSPLWKWDLKKVSLYLFVIQNQETIAGDDLRKTLDDLRKSLSDKPVLNANVLDYLLAHPNLIPEEWKGKNVCFWGTIYCHTDGDLCVRCLYWQDSRWCWGYCWLDNVFNFGYPVALAS